MGTIGSTGAPSTNTIYYDQLLSTTLMAYRKQLVDNIFGESAFLTALRDMGGYTTQAGGERIAIPLLYGKNETIKSYESYEALDTTPQDGITTAFYEWRELGGSISISRREERQNSGEGQLINLLQAKIRQAELSMREELNRQLLAGTVSGAKFIPGNGAKDMYPLGYFMRKDCTADPSVGGNVGNISGSTNSWWRHKTASADGTSDTGISFTVNVSTYAGLKVALKRMYNYCSRGAGGAPNLVVTNQETFESYENALDTQIRYTNTKMADMGFDNIKLRGATMIWDELVPDIDEGTLAATATDGTAFFLNTEFFKLVMDSETDIVTTPFVEPIGQTVKTAKILAMGNATCSNLSKLGVLYGISKSITS